ncbi:MAG: LPS export ABC transporter permease LptG [Pseudomonadota bacterium]
MRATLWFYIARRFLTIAIATFLAVFTLVIIVDLVELMRANRRGGAGFADLLGMAILHAPSITITAAPFTVLLASMTCFAILARRSELVITRAAGVSVWRLISPAVVVGALLGVMAFAVYNPIASAFTARFDTLQERFFDRTTSRLALPGKGIWLRQGDEDGQTVIRAQRASSKIDRLWDVSIFQFDAEDRLFRRIAARSAVLGDQTWRLNGVMRWDLSETAAIDTDAALAEASATRLDHMDIPTDLTVEHIHDSFATPESISFWKLPGFIKLLEESGFSSNRHKMHWYALVSAPIVYVAMVLIGAAFSMRHARFGGLGFMALGCVMAGFGYFFLSDIANALGASGSVPVLVAAWAPPMSAVLLALGLLLHLEDG